LAKSPRLLLPFILIVGLMSLYYYLMYIENYPEYNVGDLVLFAGIDFILSFFFGLGIFGLCGIISAVAFFYIHHLFTGKLQQSQKYVIIKTNYKITAGTIIKRAFLLYCMAISLTLTTLQFISVLAPDLLPDPEIDPDLFELNFELYYTTFVFIYSGAISFILIPVWYFDDLNVMFFAESEGVRYIYPFGNAVLPPLKGFGGPSIVLSYLIFILTKLGTGVLITLLLDPVLTLFMPVIMLIGFETVSAGGKNVLKKWLMKQDIKEYDEMQINLSKASKDAKT